MLSYTFLYCFLDGIFLKRELIIYSLSAGSIVVMVALASCCVKYKWKAKLANKPRSQRTHHDQVSSIQTNVPFNNESNIYDSIDEDSMNSIIIRSEYVNQAETRFSGTVDQDGSRSSISEGDVADSHNDDYLNPYQPMVEVDVHGYRFLAVESTQKSDEISSGSSINGMFGSPRGKNNNKSADAKQISTTLIVCLPMPAKSKDVNYKKDGHKP